jgi:Raf kinase inhibitor-like YbhB/YbcL family protein
MAFTLTSPAFAPRQPIPERHARDGGNISPDLEWRDPPPGTRSFVLILEDPDAPAPVFRHWIVYDIPPERRHLPESGSSKAREEELPHAVNSFGNLHYDGPQPPADHPPHTYRFRLLALGIRSLGLEPHPTGDEVWDKARENILAEAELTGTYKTRER